MADDTDEETERIQSIDSLSQRVDRQESKLDQVLSMLTGKSGSKPAPAAGDDDAPSGRPPSIADQVRAELARAKAEEKQQSEAESAKTEAQQLRERLARLEEKKPDPPQPRRQRIMWGGR